jgi:xanthosine utilization system XapX-like protein
MAYILMAIGAAFIIGDIYPLLSIKHLVWPVIITLIGVSMIFKTIPQKKAHVL